MNQHHKQRMGLRQGSSAVFIRLHCRGIAAGFDQGLTLQEPPRLVEAEHEDRRSADIGQTDNARAVQSEMLLPALASRVEERLERTREWIEGGNIRAFLTVAVQACQTEVAIRSVPTMLDRNDMVDLVRQGPVVLMQQTVLAVPVRALDHLLTEQGGNVSARHAGRATLRARAFSSSIMWFT